MTAESIYPFWDHLSEEEKERLKMFSGVRSFKKGSFIHSADDECLGVMAVLSGAIRVYIQSDEGREVTLFVLGAGEVCTLSASCAMEEITFDIFIEAAEDTELYITPSAYFRLLMEQNVYVENYMYRQAAERFSDVMWAMQQLLFTSVEQRVAGYLLDALRHLPKGTEALALKMTHEQIGRDLGTAREVVSRMLKNFEKQEIIALSRGTVTITDPAALKAILHRKPAE